MGFEGLGGRKKGEGIFLFNSCTPGALASLGLEQLVGGWAAQGYPCPSLPLILIFEKLAQG